MKNLMIKLLSLTLLVMMLAMPALAEDTDAFTSASVSSSYAETALTGEDLMNAINSFSGFYIVSTTNPDNTANAAFFIFGCAEVDGTYYLKMGLAENQSRQNLLANGEGVAVYAATPSGEEGAKPFAVAGARMRFSVVTDEAVYTALELDPKGATILCEVTEIRPLG